MRSTARRMILMTPLTQHQTPLRTGVARMPARHTFISQDLAWSPQAGVIQRQVHAACTVASSTLVSLPPAADALGCKCTFLNALCVQLASTKQDVGVARQSEMNVAFGRSSASVPERAASKAASAASRWRLRHLSSSSCGSAPMGPDGRKE
mmetsp:Transcript_2238/g.5675  ORF Transcript_2238/g.5675 Transcript_2238/m.5675 type:complete len:151 (-) Transcript_2238:299-751(-)